uniref:CCHC-type domain-containing protein n=1 Tax=Scleropages formosus TaxID=113540 RepID=A0A8C9R5F1_SCLFO
MNSNRGTVRCCSLQVVARLKCYLFYSNQPPFCWVCQGFGHPGAECTNMRYSNCLERGHMAKDYKGPRRCNICGAEDHLARTCSQRQPSYADEQKRGGGDHEREKVSSKDRGGPRPIFAGRGWKSYGLAGYGRTPLQYDDLPSSFRPE